MRIVAKLLAETPVIQQIREAIGAKEARAIYGLSGAGVSLFVAGLVGEKPLPALVVVPDDDTALRLQADLHQLVGEKVFVFLPWDFMVEKTPPGGFIPRQRLLALEALVQGEGVVVTTAAALLRGLVPPAVFQRACRVIARGDVLGPEEFIRYLSSAGYEFADVVEVPGKFTRRGGIVDFYPPGAPAPVRAEFFGDVIDSLRYFDPATQQSRAKITQVSVGPATEELYPFPAEKVVARIEEDYADFAPRLRSPQAAARLGNWVEETLAALRAGQQVPRDRILLPYFYERLAQLLDYLPSGGLCLVVEAGKCTTAAAKAEEETATFVAALEAGGMILPRQKAVYFSWDEVARRLGQRLGVALSFLPEKVPFRPNSPEIGVVFKTAPNFLGRLDALVEELQQWRRENRVLILMRKPEQARQLVAELRAREIYAQHGESVTEFLPGEVVVAEGELSEGVVFPAGRLVLLTAAEVLGRRWSLGLKGGAPTQEVGVQPALRPGEYVVHPDHGIGLYKGLTMLTVEGVTREYAVVQYAGEDRLYVPADQVGILQPYLSGEETTPRLSHLGSRQWKRAKSRALEAVREVAVDLLDLYAARETAQGYAFSPDTPWQREFEDAFPYEETPDQLRAIAEVKADMEKPRPMDRLLCGDVGYGKTEVALRAAFKAVMDHKQVAVLVPTTILAQQHYRTFKERFAPYPVTVAWLCRFKSPAEQRAVIRGLKNGTIDIVIGTHRLLQDDVSFADLGLVIIDEEQRFGVVQKEKLKLLRREVDVLTMTATPIPRTLYMSLTGIRDTSLLLTPPPDRLPVETYVMEENPVLIREAIRRELARGGQVYFVYNRVVGLGEVADRVRALVPEARVVSAHGQMPDEKLERVMLDFIDRKYDVLVATTIIENGLDIGNVNTLIVKDADQLGLAQLYQLKGRVGRTDRLAYAYFLYQRDKLINEGAKRRLQAIRDFADLGAGFKIAKRDLEIRGAGNILGVEQHGHIQAVGFELYCRMLKEAIEELKGKKEEAPVETVVELPVSAFVPEGYVPEHQKIEVYRAIADAATPAEVLAVAAALRDRYGPPPSPLENLLAVALLRAHGRRLRVRQVTRQGELYRIVFAPGQTLKAERLGMVAQKYNARLCRQKDQFTVLLPATGRHESSGSLKKLTEFLVELG